MVKVHANKENFMYGDYAGILLLTILATRRWLLPSPARWRIGMPYNWTNITASVCGDMHRDVCCDV